LQWPVSCRGRSYEWETDKKLMSEGRPDLLVVFVARKEWREMHDFFVVQAREIQAYYQQWQAEHPGKDPGRWIYKPRAQEMDILKNDPTPLINRLCDDRYSED
jgi:hypothetical protein